MDELSPEADAIPQPRGGGRNLFQVFWQRRALLVFGAVVGIVLGGLTYSQRPRIYRSNAQILVVVKRQAANALPLAGGDPRMVAMEDYVGTHMIVIRSPYVVAMAVQKQNLGTLKSLQGRDPVGSIIGGLTAGREASKDANPGTNNILNLSFTGTDPGDCETILAAVIGSYRDFLDKTYENTSKDTVQLINEAVNTLTKDLARKNEEYKKFRHDCPVVLIVGENGIPLHKSKIIEYQKKETEGFELLEAIKKRLEAVEKAAKEKQPAAFILALAERRYEKGVTDQARELKSNAKELQAALLPLGVKRVNLLNFYGPDHPEVLRVEQSIKMTEEYFKKLEALAQEGDAGKGPLDPVENALQAMRVELELARLKYEQNRDLLKAELEKARNLENYYATDRGFQEQITQLNDVLKSTMKRLQEINLVSGKGGFDARALAEPGPGGKVSPVFWQFLALGLLVGLGLSAGGAYLLDMADKSFRTPEEIRRRLGLPIIGHVSYVPAQTDPVEVVDGAGNPIELDPGLVAIHQPTSPASEGFRGIRTALYFSTHAQRHKVIQVTSPNMGDGKTTVIANLAVSIAQSGRKVLLVDADLRRPRIHRAFGLTGKVGLSEVIAGTTELEEAIQVSVVPNLSILACGRRPHNPAELLTSPRFEDVVDDLRSAFDYVLLDTPPLLAVSDPCIVAPRTDGLLLTIRLSKNGRPSAERAGDILAGLKANTLGVVVNGVGKQGSMAGYGYEHYRYADEYTTAYATSSEEPTSDIGPTHGESVAGERESCVARAADERPAAVKALVPSTNGHATHMAGE